eukprot:6335528-Alexandrium_andersonii.AAC.1
MAASPESGGSNTLLEVSSGEGGDTLVVDPTGLSLDYFLDMGPSQASAPDEVAAESTQYESGQ